MTPFSWRWTSSRCSRKRSGRPSLASAAATHAPSFARPAKPELPVANVTLETPAPVDHLVLLVRPELMASQVVLASPALLVSMVPSRLSPPTPTETAVFAPPALVDPPALPDPRVIPATRESLDVVAPTETPVVLDPPVPLVLPETMVNPETLGVQVNLANPEQPEARVCPVPRDPPDLVDPLAPVVNLVAPETVATMDVAVLRVLLASPVPMAIPAPPAVPDPPDLQARMLSTALALVALLPKPFPI